LTQASHKMAELLYSQQAEEQTASAEDAQDGEEKSSKDDEDIVDADFEEVKK